MNTELEKLDLGTRLEIAHLREEIAKLRERIAVLEGRPAFDRMQPTLPRWIDRPSPFWPATTDPYAPPYTVTCETTSGRV